jgi:hypothetical protein
MNWKLWAAARRPLWATVGTLGLAVTGTAVWVLGRVTGSKLQGAQTQLVYDSGPWHGSNAALAAVTVLGVLVAVLNVVYQRMNG